MRIRRIDRDATDETVWLCLRIQALKSHSRIELIRVPRDEQPATCGRGPERPRVAWRALDRRNGPTWLCAKRRVVQRQSAERHPIATGDHGGIRELWYSIAVSLQKVLRAAVVLGAPNVGH